MSENDAGKENCVTRFFKLDELGTTVGREVNAGLVTFLTMAYIIFANPDILSAAGMDKGALITATILASAFGTLLAGLWANVPIAMAPGMGLNAFFAYSLVRGQGLPWQTALGVVFFSGVVFLLLTVLGVREMVTRAIPLHIRLAIAGGIGLFITFIGFHNLGLIVDHPVTLVSLGKASPGVLIGLAGLLIIVVLEVRKIKGSILIGIILATLIAIICREIGPPKAYVSAPPSIAPIFLALDLGDALRWSMWSAIFAFMFMDLFDSVGTIVACSYQAGMVNADGRIEKLAPMLQADAIATVAGALLGTSTTTSYIESGAGIAEGGRSGLANVVTALLFLLALFFTPLIELVPKYATAPALIVVGVYMFKSVGDIDFKAMTIAVPSFLVLILMPLTYSISTALCFGFLSYIVCAVASGKWREVHPIMWGIGVLSAVDLVLEMG